jgi:hypothetical protein
MSKPPAFGESGQRPSRSSSCDLLTSPSTRKDFIQPTHEAIISICFAPAGQPVACQSERAGNRLDLERGDSRRNLRWQAVTPAPPPVLPEFQVKSTVVREMDVVEAPSMAGLPPVTGTIRVTVHQAEDPGLADPPPPPISLGNLPGNFRGAEREGFEWSRLVFVSATVYDHSRTLLRCHPNGNVKKEITVWSNLDFNHFNGFTSFEVTAADGKVRRYDLLLMGIGNEDTQKWAAFLAKRGRKYVPPEIPTLPDDGPAYIIKDATPDAGAVQLVEDLHTLYRHEGARMEAAYHARIKAEAEQRAYYLAHPPVPKDVTMNFWQREHPVGMAADTIKQGGGN